MIVKIFFILFFIVSQPFILISEVKEQINPHFFGAWLEKEYYKALLNGNGPCEASDKGGFYSALFIDKNEVGIHFNFHEGVSFPYVAKGKNVIEVPRPWNKDERLFLISLDYTFGEKELVLLDNEGRECRFSFYPIKYNPHSVPYSLINDLFFVGDYSIEGDEDSIVNFSVDGKVKGLKGYSRFEVFVDFVECPNFELISFYLPDSRFPQDTFHWKKSGDRLTFYFVEIDPNTSGLKIGKKFISLFKH